MFSIKFFNFWLKDRLFEASTRSLFYKGQREIWH